jgi:hypothetical protein
MHILLSPSATPTETRAWLCEALPELFSSDDFVCALDGAGLLALDEVSAGTVLKLTKFGHRRKLTMALGPSRDALSSPPPGSSSTAGSSAAAGPSSAGPSAAAGSSSAGPSAAAGSSSASSSAAGSSSAGAGSSSTAPLLVDEEEAAGEEGGCVDPQAAERQLHAEAHALGNVSWVVEKLRPLLSASRHAAWASDAVRADKLRELDKLRGKCELPGVSIVVVGNTGAGKSTLLNALLGETNVLPTNGMRACTACLINLAFDDTEGRKDAPNYRGEVGFLTQAEWARELDDLLDDITASDGPNAGRVSLSVREDSPSYGSWCKLFAVYGEHFTHSRERTDEFVGERRVYKDPTLESLKAKLVRATSITGALGSTHRVTAEAPRDFRKSLERCAENHGSHGTSARLT